MLNFDPHRWLAEHDGAESVATVATVATVARVRAEFEKSVRNPSATLREWHRRLSSLDIYAAPSSVPMNRWAVLVQDAWWIYENFASTAVRDGWSAHDLFGVFVPYPGLGGLCDRLQGARNLKMTETKAVWSRWGVPDWTCIGAGNSLVSSGLKLIWEIGHGQAE